MDTLDAKTRIMNEIDSIDVQVQVLQEKVAEMHSRKNQYKDAYTMIIAAEQQAESLLAGLLKAADVEEPEARIENIWEASAEDSESEMADDEGDLDSLPEVDQDMSLLQGESNTDLMGETLDEEPENDEINGRRKSARQVPSFLRQYL